MARHALSKKDLRNLHDKLKKNNLWSEFLENSIIEVEEHKGRKCYSVGGRHIAFEEKEFIPSLELLNAIKPNVRYFVVDNGAVPHILNGAKLFGKGISEIGEGVREGELVYIKDQTGQFIAVGRSTKNSEELKQSKEGQAAEIVLIPGKNPC